MDVAMNERIVRHTTRLRPAHFCQELLVALDASEGRRRRRKRNTTADAIGLEIKRGLLERCMEHNPEPDDFEAWLLEQVLSTGSGSGGVRAMAMSILDEWRLAVAGDSYGDWLARGAPSDDRLPVQENGG